jgi:hypothetical protein
MSAQVVCMQLHIGPASIMAVAPYPVATLNAAVGLPRQTPVDNALQLAQPANFSMVATVHLAVAELVNGAVHRESLVTTVVETFNVDIGRTAPFNATELASDSPFNFGFYNLFSYCRFCLL